MAFVEFDGKLDEPGAATPEQKFVPFSGKLDDVTPADQSAASAKFVPFDGKLDDVKPSQSIEPSYIDPMTGIDPSGATQEKTAGSIPGSVMDNFVPNPNVDPNQQRSAEPGLEAWTKREVDDIKSKSIPEQIELAKTNPLAAKIAQQSIDNYQRMTNGPAKPTSAQDILSLTNTRLHEGGPSATNVAPDFWANWRQSYMPQVLLSKITNLPGFGGGSPFSDSPEESDKRIEQARAIEDFQQQLSQKSWGDVAKGVGAATMDVAGGAPGFVVGLAAFPTVTALSGDPRKGEEFGKYVMQSLTPSEVLTKLGYKIPRDSPYYEAAMFPFTVLNAGADQTGEGWQEIAKAAGAPPEQQEKIKSLFTMMALGATAFAGGRHLHEAPDVAARPEPLPADRQPELQRQAPAAPETIPPATEAQPSAPLPEFKAPPIETPSEPTPTATIADIGKATSVDEAIEAAKASLPEVKPVDTNINDTAAQLQAIRPLPEVAKPVTEPVKSPADIERANEDNQAISQALGGHQDAVVNADGTVDFRGARVEPVAKEALPEHSTAGESELSRQQAEAIDKLLSLRGQKLVVYADHPNLPDGFVDPNDSSRLFLSNKTSRGADIVAGHELNHLMERTAPAAYKAYLDTVREELKSGAMEDAAGAHKSVSLPDSLHREIGADIAGNAMRDPVFVSKVMDKIRARMGDDAAQPIARKLIDNLGKTIARIKELVKGGMFKNKAEGLDVAKAYINNLERVHDALADVYAEHFAQSHVMSDAVPEVPEAVPTINKPVQAGRLKAEVERLKASKTGKDFVAKPPEQKPVEPVVRPAEQVQQTLFSPKREEAALEALSKTDHIFQLPKSNKDTVAGIAEDHKSGLKVEKLDHPGSKAYKVTAPDGSTGTIMVRDPSPHVKSVYAYRMHEGEMKEVVGERPGRNPEAAAGKGDVWIDVSKLNEGSGFGNVMYNIAATYAHNTGRVFIGDPAGLLDPAMFRRPEHMLSSALKFGTTEHLAPHPWQIAGDPSIGVPPLDWVYGDHIGNIRKLIDHHLQKIDNAGGNGDISYNEKTGKFYGSDGHELLREDLHGLRKSGLGRQAYAGGSTLARSAVLRALRESGSHDVQADAGAGSQGRIAHEGSDGQAGVGRSIPSRDAGDSTGARSLRDGAVSQEQNRQDTGPGRDGVGLLERLVHLSSEQTAATKRLFYSEKRDNVEQENPAGQLAGRASPKSNLPGDSMISHAVESFSDLIDAGMNKSKIYEALAPMSAGTQATRAIAQRHINLERKAQYQWAEIDKVLTKDFTPEQRRNMWEAADEENDMRRAGQTAADRGINRLPEQERKVMDTLHQYAEELWQRAKDSGLVSPDAEGVHYWTPRMMAKVDEEGNFSRPSEGQQATGDGVGRNITTSAGSARQRKYETAAETEAAMKAKGGELVRDIRTMPMAMAKMERAIAGRELINQIKALGKATGKELVAEHAAPDFFTLDHPAFKTFKPRMVEEDGKMVPARDENGDIVFDKVPIYISNEFKGPLKAIMTTTKHPAYTGYMLLKSKAMSAIMYSPLIHNQVILGRALAYGGIKTPVLYFTGHAAKGDRAFMQKMIEAGMVPIGAHNTMLDVGDIAEGRLGKEGGWLDPNESWIGLSAKAVGNKISDGLGDKVKAGIDKAGDIWHNKLLWDRIGDLQAGIAQDVYAKLKAQGIDENAAVTVAAHIANRYAGAIGRESMSQLSHVVANVTLFSKSFNAGNVGTVKDVFYGLPAGLKAQLMENSSAKSAIVAMQFAKYKARVGLVRDIAYAIVLTSLVQDWFKRDKDADWSMDSVYHGWDQYKQRAMDMWANAKDNPLSPSSYNPLRLASTWNNEPGKQDRVDLGAQDTGRHEYMRLPTGKVYEDTLGWALHAGDTFDNKMSPFLKAAMGLKTGVKDKYGTPISDPNSAMLKRAAQVAEFLVSTVMPLDQIKAVKDIATDHGTELDKAKLRGNFTGFSISQGHPNGPEAGVAAEVENRITASKRFAMEEARRSMKYGDEDGARDILENAGLTPQEITSTLHRIDSPRDGLSASQHKRFNQHATEEDQRRMDRVSR